MNNHLTADDIDRYLAGEEVGENVRAYLAAHSAGEEVVRAVRQTVHAWGGESIGFDPNKSLLSITTIPVSRLRLPLRYVGIAAAIIISIVGIKFLLSTPPSQTKTYSTAPGQRANIQLADGSSAILAPATIIHVAGRNVDLVGQAVFTVNQHTSVPFIVRANGIITRVLGTSFGIRAYDSTVTVAVRDGKVSIANAILSAGDAAVAHVGNQPIVTHNADLSSLLGWTEGRLSFHGQPLGEVASDLSRNYAAEIAVDSGIANRKVILDVGPNDTLSEVLDALARSLNVRVERQGTKYRLSL